jgi:decaprenylphospho-beta-D-ribofuranose 2-oxidase
VPAAAGGLAGALERCDALVVAAGGRVYLCKDARMRAETTRAMYPRLPEWQAIRDELDPDGLWRSDLALRTGLVGA